MSDEALSSATPHNKGPMQVSGDSFLPADSGIEGPSNLWGCQLNKGDKVTAPEEERDHSWLS